MKLYVTQIEKLKELNTLNENTCKIIDVFLAAINDWPDMVLSFEDFESEIHELIKNIPTKKNIEIFLKEKKFEKNAWESESLSQLIEVYQFYNDTLSVKEIIEDLKQKMNFQNISWYR